MKKFLLTLVVAVLGFTSSWAATTVVFNFTKDTYGMGPAYNGGSTAYVTTQNTASQDGVTIKFSSSSNSNTAWRFWSDGLRAYKNQNAYFQVNAPSGYVLTNLNMDLDGGTYVLDGTNSTITSWSGKAESLKFNYTYNDNKAIKSITVTYEEASTLKTYTAPFDEKIYSVEVGKQKTIEAGNDAPPFSFTYGSPLKVEKRNDEIIITGISITEEASEVKVYWGGEGYKEGEAHFYVNVVPAGSEPVTPDDDQIYTSVINASSFGQTASSYALQTFEDKDYGYTYQAVLAANGTDIQFNTNNKNGGKGSALAATSIGEEYFISSIKINSTSLSSLDVYSYDKECPAPILSTSYSIPSSATKITGNNGEYEINNKAFIIVPNATGQITLTLTVNYKKNSNGEEPDPGPTTPKELDKFEYSATTATWDLNEGASNSALPTLEILPADANITVTFNSSDEAVATVDSDGTVSPKTEGTTTITASFAGNDDYKANSASYILTVKNTTQGDVPETAKLKESFGDNGPNINDADHFDPLLPSGSYSNEVKTSKSLTTRITYTVKQGYITQQSNNYFLQLKANESELSFTTPSNCKEIIFTLGVGSAKTVTANISEEDSDAFTMNFDSSGASPNVYTVTKPGKTISIKPTTTLKIAALTFVLDGEAKPSCDDPKFILNNVSTLENGSYLYGEDKIYLTTDTEGADIYYTINGGEKTKFDSESPITFTKNDDYVIAAWSSMEDGSYADSGQVTYTIHYRKVNPQGKYTAILVTDFSEFEPGNQYLIVGTNTSNGTYNVMTNDCVNAFNVVENAEVNEDGSQVLFRENMSKVTFEKDEEGDFWNMLLDNGDYIATNYTNTNNYVTTSSEINEKTKVTISMNEDNTFNIAFKEGGYFKYNPSSPRFSCYSEKSQNNPYLYRLYVSDDPIVAKASWSLDSEDTDVDFDFETSRANKVTLKMTIDCEDDDIESYTIRLGDHRWTITPDEEGNVTLEIPYVEYALTKEPISVRGMIRGERTTYYDVELEEFVSVFEEEEFEQNGHTHSMTNNFSYGVYNWSAETQKAQVALFVNYDFVHNGHDDAHYVVTGYQVENYDETVEFDYSNNQASIWDFATIDLDDEADFVEALKSATLPKIKATTTVSYPVIYLAEPEVIIIAKEDALNKKIMKVDGESPEYIKKVYTSEYTEEVDAPTPTDGVITGIDEIVTDSAVSGDATYFNLQGVKIDKPEKGAIYIIVKDGKSQKIIF